jgi:hypothetical protein
MRLALDQAHNALLVGEVPVGAIILRHTDSGPPYAPFEIPMRMREACRCHAAAPDRGQGGMSSARAGMSSARAGMNSARRWVDDRSVAPGALCACRDAQFAV